ncbi:MAG: RNA 2',3'-cyclic phosphodiesterase [Thermoplasmata archaeon]|nr:RNA 2',3'-cyclic phosphodiesterase [Thermoplasmata archaeon]MCI4362574.1 RNA 2',3'-cyclic phosphodiesterase [Thermoplasmata archaeon]MCI4369728.1 RNA 2',3'-cyclic phosphodiesterase [Thermoplasmata archaeon]
MRAFVAVEVPDPHRPSVPDAAPAHLTLKFLGEIDPTLAAPLGAALAAAVGSRPAFPLELRGVGAFPDRAHPRVAWVGVGEGGEAVRDLARRVDRAATSVGLPVEDRPFVPHTTWMRVRGPRDIVVAERWLAAGDDRSFGRTTVREVILFESELRRDGVVHHPVRRCPLEGPASASPDEGSFCVVAGGPSVTHRRQR